MSSSIGVPSVSVGIFAHNEEATIRRVVHGFLDQRDAGIREIIVVCCACTDRTVQVVRELAAVDSRVRPLVRPTREGKVAAINEFLQVASSEALVLSSGDVIPAADLVGLLLAPLAADPLCMMSGPQVVTSTRSQPRAVDRLHALLWDLHHAVALRSPKLGEIVAVRRAALAAGLPAGVHCDEALIEAIVAERGGRLAYVADALAYNFAPGTLAELYRQRRRIAAQHLTLKRLRGYRPATAGAGHLASAVRTVLTASISHWPVLALLATVESVARAHGRWDLRRGRDYRLWRVSRPLSRPPRVEVASWPLPTRTELGDGAAARDDVCEV